jgi:C-terminal processing protease CtpA/Prc
MKHHVASVALALVCLLPAVAPAAAQSADALAQQASSAYARKDYARSADLFAAAIRAGATDPNVFYNAACANARAGRVDAAFELLARALEAGFVDVANLEKDPDLESLRADPRWAPLVERFKTTAAARERFWNGPALATGYRAELSEDERVAGLSRLWAEVKFDFANFDLVPDLDWDAVYAAYLPRVRQARSTLEYYRLLMEAAAKLRDGHTGVWVPAELVDEVYARPALRTAVVEDRVVVARLIDEALRVDGVEPGVEILEVEGVPVRQYGAERVAPYQSASTPQDLETRTYVYALLSGSASTPVEVTLRSASGEVFKRKLRRLSNEERAEMPQTPPMEIRMLPGNVAYVALNRFDVDAAAEQFEAKFAEIARADALVLDVRENGGGNSDVGYRVLACLTDRAFKTSRWRTRDYRPTYRAWGRAEGVYQEEAGEFEPNGKLLFSKPVVVLTSARTYSAAEDFTVAFDAMKRGTIVGEPTGGSTGQPLIFRLPGGGGARVCTKRDTYPDGKEFVGVGVQPQVLVRPRLDDLRAGRHTVLEAALAYLRSARAAR